MPSKKPRIKDIDHTVARIAMKYGISDEDTDIISHMLHSVVESRDNHINYLENKIEHSHTIVEEKLRITSNIIGGALKSCINSHGPITSKYIASATKRIIGGLL